MLLAGDFGVRINETKFGGVERQALHLLGFEETDGIVHFEFAAFAALGLELFELAESFFHRTVQR